MSSDIEPTGPGGLLAFVAPRVSAPRNVKRNASLFCSVAYVSGVGMRQRDGAVQERNLLIGRTTVKPYGID